MFKPLVSYIVPCYNYQKYIADCLHSILNQTYKNIEIIVIDDGSTDNSLKIVKEILRDRPQTQIISQTNQGQLSSKNKGMELANGEFISIIDADDFIPSDRTVKMMEAFQKNPEAVLVYGDALVVDDTGKILRKFKDIYPPKSGDFSVEMWANYCFAPLISIMFKKSIFNKTGSFWSTAPSGQNQDYMKFIEMGLQGKVIALPTEILGYYRRHANNITAGTLEKKIRQYSIQKANLEEVLRRHPDLKNKIGEKRIKKRLAFCHFMAGFYAGLENNWLLAGEQYSKAIRINPSITNKLAKISTLLPFRLLNPLAYRLAGRKLY